MKAQRGDRMRKKRRRREEEAVESSLTAKSV